MPDQPHQWVVVIEVCRPDSKVGIGLPFVHRVQGDRDAARAAATGEALAAWGQDRKMKRRSIVHAYQVSQDQWLIEADGDWANRWLRVSVAEAVRLPSSRPWQS